MEWIFDLDETLISCLPRFFVKPKYCRKYKNQIYDSEFRIFLRPGVIEFLNFLLENKCQIHLFSRGVYDYVNFCAKFIEQYIDGKFTKILTRDDCHIQFSFEGPLLLKPLHQHFDNLENVILLDDNYENRTFNEYNFILCPEFNLAKKLKNEYLFFNKLLNQIKKSGFENKDIIINSINNLN
jgi:hypothetical protein